MIFAFCESLSIYSCDYWYPTYLICCFNTVILLIFAGFLTLKLIITAFVLIVKFKSKHIKYLAFHEAFNQSIFSYMKTASFRNNIKFYILHFIIAYGIFFLRPLGYLIGMAFSRYFDGDSFPLLMVVILPKVATETLFFFNVIFMVNFYGLKTEILRFKGDPSVISPVERRKFLIMLIGRSIVFALLYFGCSLVRLFSNIHIFTVYTMQDNPLLDWCLRGIQYAFIIALTQKRLAYIGFDEEMAREKLIRKRRYFPLLSFTKHVEDYSISAKGVQELVWNLDATGESLVKDFEQVLAQKCKTSSLVFNGKTSTLTHSEMPYQPSLRSPMENYLAGKAWLICALIDSISNTILSFGVVLIRMLQYDITKYNPVLNIVIIIVSILYVFETLVQGGLCNYIAGSKTNFGDHLETGSLISEGQSSSYSLEIRYSEAPDGENLEPEPRRASFGIDLENRA